jgi:hypothetical protein
MLPRWQGRFRRQDKPGRVAAGAGQSEFDDRPVGVIEQGFGEVRNASQIDHSPQRKARPAVFDMAVELPLRSSMVKSEIGFGVPLPNVADQEFVFTIFRPKGGSGAAKPGRAAH